MPAPQENPHRLPLDKYLPSPQYLYLSSLSGCFSNTSALPTVTMLCPVGGQTFTKDNVPDAHCADGKKSMHLLVVTTHVQEVANIGIGHSYLPEYILSNQNSKYYPLSGNIQANHLAMLGQPEELHDNLKCLNITCKCALPMPPPTKPAKSPATGANAIPLGIRKTPTLARQLQEKLASKVHTISTHKPPPISINYLHELIILSGTVDSHQAKNIMIDSGAQGNFISKDFVKRNKIPIHKASGSYQVTMADKQVRVYASEYVQVTLKIHNYQLKLQLIMIDIHHDVILRKPWLSQENPTID